MGVSSSTWLGAVAAVHAAKLSVFGIPATWKTSDGFQYAITGVVEKNPMLEDVPAASILGTSVVHFWVDFNHLQTEAQQAAGVAPAGIVPQKGDRIEVSGVNYDLVEAETDTDGGSILKLRRNA